MFRKGQKVRVQSYKRTRTIFNGGEYDPGQTVTHKGGWTGRITNIFEGPLPIEVKKDGTNQGAGYYDFEPSELQAI